MNGAESWTSGTIQKRARRARAEESTISINQYPILLMKATVVDEICSASVRVCAPDSERSREAREKCKRN